MSADPGRGQKSKWPFFSLLPLGLGAWAPIYAGVKARRSAWTALGAIWSAVVVGGWVLSTQHRHANSFAGFVIILGWVGAIATSFIIRAAYDRQVGSTLEAATEAGQARMRERANAIEMARRNPALAREIGIGRPDLTDATDAGLVDVNNASVTAMLKLPGVDGTSRPRSSRRAKRSTASPRSRNSANSSISMAGSSSVCAAGSYSCRAEGCVASNAA